MTPGNTVTDGPAWHGNAVPPQMTQSLHETEGLTVMAGADAS